MSERSKQNVKMKPRPEDKDVEETDALLKKNKLLMEIRTLKLLIAQTECKFTPTKFKDLQQGMTKTQSMSPFGGSSQLADVKATFQNDLCTYAGFCCKKMDGELVFAFPLLNRRTRVKEGCIQLLKVGERWQLGHWIMPLGIHVGTIFVKYSMDSHTDIKFFLRECKHLLECHVRREYEFKMLEAHMNHMRRYGCTVEALYQYTVTTIKLVTKRGSPLDKTRIILVYLISKKDGVTPTKIKIDSEDDNELSEDWKRKLRHFFHCFKEMSLINAANHTLASSDSPFVWKDPSKDDSIIEMNGEEPDNMDTSSLLQLLRKKSRTPKKRRRDSTEVNESAIEKAENDLSSEIIEGSDPEVYEAESPQVGSRSTKRPKHATDKKAKPVVRKSTAKKINDVAKRGKARAEVDESAHEREGNVLTAETVDRPDPEICEVDISDNKSKSVKKSNRVRRKSIIKRRTNVATTNDRENIPVVELPDTPEARRGTTEDYPLKDSNDNFVGSSFENKLRKTAAKSSNNNNEVQATLPQFFKLPKRVSSETPADNNEKLSKRDDRASLAGPKFFKLQRQRSNAPPANTNVNSLTTPKGRSTERLLSSTPIPESAALTAIAEENISAIIKENTFVQKTIIGNDKNERANDLTDHPDSDESDEKDITEVCNDHAALLKDLQEVKYNNNAMKKGAKKSIKQHIKPSSRGKNKFSKI